MPSQQTHADRITRTLKRLGFGLSRTGRTFRIVRTQTGELAPGTTTAGMSLQEIERWIGDHIKPGKTA
jgi:hypothetical protein